LLSNVPREQWGRLAPIYESSVASCNELVLSFEVGCAKPEARMYEQCLERLAVSPEEALFVDDVPANVEAAAALGMQAVQYQSVSGLRAELRSRFGSELPLP
jgi:FMN phosphatase YigB (HAD superfamily)